MGRYAFAQAFIKHKILSNETRFQSPLLYFSCIGNDAAMQLVHVFKTMVAQPGAGLFAAHSSGAIQENLLVLFLLQFVDHQFYFFPKSVGGGTPGVDKVTDFAFVGIAHVHHHYILLLREFVKFKGREVGAYIGGIEYAIVETVGHNFRTHPYNQLKEGFTLIFNGPFERHVAQFGYRVHIVQEVLDVVLGYIHLGINALPGDIDSAVAAQSIEGQIQCIAKHIGVRYVYITVKRQGASLKVLCLQAGQELGASEFVIKCHENYFFAKISILG